MLDQTNVVDFIGLDDKTTKCKLAITDHHNWEDELNHLLLLQEKINAYISFIESGEIYKSYPLSKEKQMEIEIHFKYQPSNKCIAFLEQVMLVLKEIDAELSWEVHSTLN